MQFHVPADLKSFANIADLKDRLRITVTTDDVMLQRSIDAASRFVAHTCQRRFDQTVSQVRYYELPNRVDWKTTIEIHDVADTASAVVEVDQNAAGTFPTTWTADVQFQWRPFNANVDGWPADGLQFNDLSSWIPLAFTYQQRTNSPRLRITALFGWPAVPDAVAEATLILAAAIYRRKDSPDGIAGSNEFGVIRVSKYMDPTASSLLEPYRRTAGAQGGFA